MQCDGDENRAMISSTNEIWGNFNRALKYAINRMGSTINDGAAKGVVISVVMVYVPVRLISPQVMGVRCGEEG